MIFLLLLLLPSQLALHFWPSWSLVNGIRVDYLSPTIYLTDLIIFGLFLTSRLRIRVPLVVIVFAVLNTLNSTLPPLAIYKWFRLLEYFWLFKYLTLKIDLKLKIKNLKFAVLWTSALAWWQFFLQHSVGGLWWWLGERPLSATLPAIAKVSYVGQVVMRPYATFPHPNALAGFLLIAVLLLARRFRWVAILALLTIPLTFSRTAIVLEILILIIGICLKISNLKLKIVSIIALALLLFYSLAFISGSFVSDRLPLILNSLFLIQKFPLLGVGLGSFIPATGLYQPVHNIYLLVASELGLPAVFFIGYWVIKKYNSFAGKLKIALAVVLATGAVDHYWLTLHQNSLLLVVLLALIKVQ